MEEIHLFKAILKLSFIWYFTFGICTDAQESSLGEKGSSQAIGHSVSYVPSKQWGKYEVITPDNQILLVTYTADEKGYQPVLRYLNDKKELEEVLKKLPEPYNHPTKLDPIPKVLETINTKNINQPFKETPIYDYEEILKDYPFDSDIKIYPNFNTGHDTVSFKEDEPYFDDSSIPVYSSYPIQSWDSKKIPSKKPEIPYGYKLGTDVVIRQNIPYDESLTFPKYPDEPFYTTSTPLPYKPKITSFEKAFSKYFDYFTPIPYGNKVKTEELPSHNNGEPYFNPIFPDIQKVPTYDKNDIDRALFYEDTERMNTTVSSEWNSTLSHETRVENDVFYDDEIESAGDIEGSMWEMTTSNPIQQTTSFDTDDETEMPITIIPVNGDSFDIDMVDDPVDGSLPRIDGFDGTEMPELSMLVETENPFFFEVNSTMMNEDFDEQTTESYLEVTTDPTDELETILPEINFDQNEPTNITELIDKLRVLGMTKISEERLMNITSTKSISQQLRLMANIADFLADQDPETLESVLKGSNTEELFSPSGEVMMIIPNKNSDQFVAVSVFPGNDSTANNTQNSTR